MNRELNDSLLELYVQGGFELYLEGTRGIKRDVIIDTEANELSSDLGKVTCYRGVNRLDDIDEFDE
jgi:hypothetical protein